MFSILKEAYLYSGPLTSYYRGLSPSYWIARQSDKAVCMVVLFKGVPGRGAAAFVCTKLAGATATLYTRFSSPCGLSRTAVGLFLLLNFIVHYGHATGQFIQEHVEEYSRHYVTWNQTGFGDDTARPEEGSPHSNGTGSKSSHQRVVPANENLS